MSPLAAREERPVPASYEHFGFADQPLRPPPLGRRLPVGAAADGQARINQARCNLMAGGERRSGPEIEDIEQHPKPACLIIGWRGGGARGLCLAGEPALEPGQRLQPHFGQRAEWHDRGKRYIQPIAAQPEAVKIGSGAENEILAIRKTAFGYAIREVRQIDVRSVRERAALEKDDIGAKARRPERRRLRRSPVWIDRES